MMILSRFWYVILSLALGVALYVVYLSVGEYNRRNAVAMAEELASDSQTVGWALQIDARKRLDALLIGAVDKGIKDALLGANAKDPLPAKPKDDGRKALLAILDKVPPDFRPDALFAIDHDGRVVAQVGFDQANAFPDFELGGYPAAFDAMHGYLRDDTWVLGGKIYRVVARPVESDADSPPAGALVGLRLVDKKFVQDLSKRTRANIAFYTSGQRVASAVLEGGPLEKVRLDDSTLDLISADLPKLATDKSYSEGRSDVRPLTENVGVMYARLFGDAWELGAGFAVARTRVSIGAGTAAPLGFLNEADDKDKQSVPFILLAVVVVLGIGVGLLLSLLEHSIPLKEMIVQSAKLRKGELDYLQLARFRGGYRAIAQEVNAGIERVIEKGGGGVRRPADLESILGPVPAQPAMSAFSFPLKEGPGAAPTRQAGPPQKTSGTLSEPFAATRPGQPPPKPSGPGGPGEAPTLAMQDQIQPIAPLQGPPIPPMPPPFSPTGGASSPGSFGLPATQTSASPFGFPAPPPPRPVGAPIVPAGHDQSPADADGPTLAAPSPVVSGEGASAMQGPRGPIAAAANAPARSPQGGVPASGSSGGRRRGAATIIGVGGQSTPGAGPNPPQRVPMTVPSGNPLNVATQPNDLYPSTQSARVQLAPPSPGGTTALSRGVGGESEDEATVVAPTPGDVLSKAAAANKGASDEATEWMSVYEDFVRTKKQCGEPTDGLTFEKFEHTLKKNRDALMQRHNCKRVRFSVYIKEGRASLKATPVRE